MWDMRDIFMAVSGMGIMGKRIRRTGIRRMGVMRFAASALFALSCVVIAACGGDATEIAGSPADSLPQSQAQSQTQSQAAVSSGGAQGGTQTPPTAVAHTVAPAPTGVSNLTAAPNTATVVPTAAAAPTQTPATAATLPAATAAPVSGTASSPTPEPTQAAGQATSQTVGQTTDQAVVQSTDGGATTAVQPDPDYERLFGAAGLSARGWDTDFSRHTVPYSEIKFVIPRDNIPSIDDPKFVGTREAAAWLKGVEPVVSLEIEGDVRAYPLQILTWHEIVNDMVGDVPVAVTFCPLCNSAIAFDRRLDGQVLEFGVSGNLRNSDLIMYDRQTHSWWQQFTGEGIVGEHAGRSLDYIFASIVSFDDFSAAHPDGRVLSRDTGYARQYGRNPYAGYDTFGGNPFLFTGDLDGRLLPVERVVAVTIDGVDVAFPLSALQEEGVINYAVGGRQIAVFHKFGTASALDASTIADSRDVGAAGVFDALLDGQTLTFSVRDGAIVDDNTGSVWDIFGNAVEGTLAGKSLAPVVHGNHFWFAWAVFKPDTILYQGRNGL